MFKIDFKFEKGQEIKLSYKKKDKFNIPYFLDWTIFKDKNSFASQFPKQNEDLEIIKTWVQNKYQEEITKSMAYTIFKENRVNFQVNNFSKLTADERNFIFGYVELIIQKSLLAFNFNPIKILTDIYNNFVHYIENTEIPILDFKDLIRQRPTKELQRELTSKNFD